MLSSSLIHQIDALIRRDPAARGLISSEPIHGPLCPGHLAKAAEELAGSARHVAIVTGFFVSAAEPPAAEPDGAPRRRDRWAPRRNCARGGAGLDRNRDVDNHGLALCRRGSRSGCRGRTGAL